MGAKSHKWLTYMANSMTGFATLGGEDLGWTWVWEIRSVNARGFDLRLRLPDWLDGLDQKVRGAIGKAVARGSVSISLRLSKAESGPAEAVDPDALAQVVGQLTKVTEAAEQAGLSLAATSAAEILSLRGVLKSDAKHEDPGALVQAVTKDLHVVLAAFNDMRQGEGRALLDVLSKQLDHIEELTKAAADVAHARKAEWDARLKENLARVIDLAEGADPDRVAQELAMMVVKSDVTEELDRLSAHVEAARKLLTSNAPIGRKLDFLSQEFNREANTICSKAQSTDLTQIGLDLKAVIDQMREQVQNVE